MKRNILLGLSALLVLGLVAIALGQTAEVPLPPATDVPVDPTLDTIVTIVVAVAGIFGSIISALFIKGKVAVSGMIKAKVQNEAVASILDNVNTAAWWVAENLYEAYVKDMKAAKADGKLTKDEITQLKGLALTQMKKMLGPASLLALGQAGVQDVDSMLTGAVEHAAQLSKERNKATKTPSVPPKK